MVDFLAAPRQRVLEMEQLPQVVGLDVLDGPAQPDLDLDDGNQHLVAYDLHFSTARLATRSLCVCGKNSYLMLANI